MQDEKSTELIRHELGSIDLSDVEDEKEMSETDRKDYVAAIGAVWPRLEKDLKKFLFTQLMFSSNQANSWDQVLFGRGTFNGIDLLLEHWKKAHLEHVANATPEEPFDKHDPIGSVE